jgi:hypothetical protein
VIKRYELKEGSNVLVVRRGSRVLSVAKWKGVSVWIDEPDTKELINLEIRSVGTGSERPSGFYYLGTLLYEDLGLVFHYFFKWRAETI